MIRSAEFDARLAAKTAGEQRLFAIECARRCLALCPNETGSTALAVAERMANGAADDVEIAAARAVARLASETVDGYTHPLMAVRAALWSDALAAALRAAADEQWFVARIAEVRGSWNFSGGPWGSRWEWISETRAAEAKASAEKTVFAMQLRQLA